MAFPGLFLHNDPMQCNIDQKGRRVRTGWGVLMLLACLAAGGAGWFGMLGPGWAWGLGLLFLAAALFAFYEARKGWCAVRAMGFKTPF